MTFHTYMGPRDDGQPIRFGDRPATVLEHRWHDSREQRIFTRRYLLVAWCSLTQQAWYEPEQFAVMTWQA